MDFFNNLDQQKIELNSLNKLTIENSVEWTNFWKSYLFKNNLTDFLMPKSNHHSFKEQHLLIDLILLTISDQFKKIYLNNFKYHSFNDLWLELNRCFQYPLLKPILNELQSIKLHNFNCLIDYCKEFSNLLDKIPNEFIDNNFHNIMSLFYQSNDNKIVHICFRRLVDNNQKLILPKNKLFNKQLDHKLSIKPKFSSKLEYNNHQQFNYQNKRDHSSAFGDIRNKSNQRSSNSNNQRSSNSINQRPSNSINQRSSNSNNQRSSNSINQRPSNSINKRSSDSNNQRPSNSNNQRPSNSINQRSSNSNNQRPSNSNNQRSSNSNIQKSSNSNNQRPSNSNNQRSPKSMNKIYNLSNIKHYQHNLSNNQLDNRNLVDSNSQSATKNSINKNSQSATKNSINKNSQSATKNSINKGPHSITRNFANLNLDQPNQIICGYCKNAGHIKRNCFNLKNKI